jgi:hypothetical protein
MTVLNAMQAGEAEEVMHPLARQKMKGAAHSRWPPLAVAAWSAIMVFGGLEGPPQQVWPLI